jgi:recombination protein RecT
MAAPTNELATRQQKSPVLQAIEQAKPQFEGRLTKSMPNLTTERFMFGIATAVQKNPILLDCEPKSVLLAAYEAAELGVNMNPSLQLGYMIPYGKQAQFQLGYRGMVQKATRLE